jgi:rhamnogalacturonan endolyase
MVTMSSGMNFSYLAMGALLLSGFISRPTAAIEAPATAVEAGGHVILDNDILKLDIDAKKFYVRSIRYRVNGVETELTNQKDGLYLDVNGGPTDLPEGEEETDRPKAGYDAIGGMCQSIRIGQSGPEMAEAIISGNPVKWFPFQTEVHYVLPRGQSGFYAYVIYRHGPGMPGGGIGQTRFVIKGVPGTALYTNHVVDDKRNGPFPTSKVVSSVQDATFKLEDGTIYTKYDNSAFTADDWVHGMAGHGVGLWTIWPSHEFLNGGPLRQDLTVHMDNALLAMLQGGHFGGGAIHVEDGETWSRFYGPFMFYANHGASIAALWDDAKIRAAKERVQWPYAWVKNDGYPLQRGTVEGKVQLITSAPTQGAWVVLAPPSDIDWAVSAKGYMFYTQVDSSGRFSIPKVRPGTYDLFISGANQFEDFKQTGVIVDADHTTDLGDLKWTPLTHGKTLWQIGIADRSTREFKDGDNVRHYGNFLRYPTNFPDDVNFVIGQSHEQSDWNFAQWSWYSQKPDWTIQFNVAEPYQGKATLTLGLASVQLVGDLVVKLNGKVIDRLRFKKSGAAAYRSGGQDSTYNLAYVTFDAAQLRQGHNEISLGDSRALRFSAPVEQRNHSFGSIMYDAIRLEVAQ